MLVEPRIILQAPDDYLLAGIGDTLAKWYEAVVLAPQPETLPLTVRLGINSACAIRDLLLDSSEQALADKQQRRLTGHFATWWMRLLLAAVWSAASGTLYPCRRRPCGTQRSDRPAANGKIPARNESGLWHSGAKRYWDKMTCWRN